MAAAESPADDSSAGGVKALPIHAFESQIVKAVSESPAIVLIGETGSGKTTQIAQFLHRAGYSEKGVIGVTQPRRVAAVTVARRVAQEMHVSVGDEVGYSVRFEDRTSQRTRIKYLTDGCLLRECLHDLDLRQYSVIVLDEAHERSLNTDILFGILRRLVASRKPELKVVITSATLEGEKFSEFFHHCPLLKVPGKLFPIEILHSTERPSSYLASAVETVMDIHMREGEGDILLFLTGQDEIQKTITKLEEAVQLQEEGSCPDVIIVPLHASLPPEMQARAFVPTPPGCRKIVVATNVAETSLTIDGIVFVVDPGYVKQRQYNPTTGMDSLAVVPISKVQATQRAGRAGRTRPGKCYRLYSASTFKHELPEVTPPEIQRSSLTGAVLHLKSLNLADMDILSFDFLDPPMEGSLEDALRQLYVLDAINIDGRITPLGQRMAGLPLEPSLARSLIESEKLGCMEDALTVAAMLSCENIFFQASRGREQTGEASGLPNGGGLGDHIQLLQIYEAWERTGFDMEWCKRHSLQTRSMKFARDVRRQLAAAMGSKRAKEEDLGRRDAAGERHGKEGRREREDSGRGKRKREGEAMRALLKALCVGFANRIARRMARHNGYKTIGQKSVLVQLHPGTALIEADEEGLLPEWVLFHELVATSRPFIRQVCRVEGAWVEPLLPKLEDVDVHRLSGRKESLPSSTVEVSHARDGEGKGGEKGQNLTQTKDADIAAARARFLARKKGKFK